MFCDPVDGYTVPASGIAGNQRKLSNGQSLPRRWWGRQGWADQMENALKAVYPDAKPNIITLGGSGQGIGSWSGIEKNSRTSLFSGIGSGRQSSQRFMA